MNSLQVEFSFLFVDPIPCYQRTICGVTEADLQCNLPLLPGDSFTLDVTVYGRLGMDPVPEDPSTTSIALRASFATGENDVIVSRVRAESQDGLDCDDDTPGIPSAVADGSVEFHHRSRTAEELCHWENVREVLVARIA